MSDGCHVLLSACAKIKISRRATYGSTEVGCFHYPECGRDGCTGTHEHELLLHLLLYRIKKVGKPLVSPRRRCEYNIKMNLKYFIMMWTTSIWQRSGSSGELLCTH
jgi:hypothetical protein